MNEELNTDEIERAELGEEARSFLASKLGEALHGMAIAEVIAAQEALEKVAPDDVKRIMELQNQAWRARSFEQWLLELVDRGNAAIAALAQQMETR